MRYVTREREREREREKEGEEERKKMKEREKEKDFFLEEAIYGKIARRGVKNFERRATSGWVQQVIADDVWLFPSLVVSLLSVRTTLFMLLYMTMNPRCVHPQIQNSTYSISVSRHSYRNSMRTDDLSEWR